MKWTDAQEKVIRTRGCNLLVAAAAGSGKTAVLVQRIIEMLTDEKDPVEIDQMLVVTFTNAAAAEMRERIARGIEEKIQERRLQNLSTEYLSRQKLYTNTAKICTIHSFCLDLIREHFEDLAIDPSFRIGDETELKLLQADVLRDVMEVYYASGNTEFRKLVDAYGTKNSDDSIASMIESIYKRCVGCPWPDYWLDMVADQYKVTVDQMDRHPLVVFAMEEAGRTIDRCISLMEQEVRFCEETEYMDFYLDTAHDDLDRVSALKQLRDFDACREKLMTFELKRKPAFKGARKLSEAEKKTQKAGSEQFDSYRSGVKKALKDLCERLFVQSLQDIVQEMAYIYPYVVTLTGVVRTFIQEYQKAKADRNMMDFNDLEHYALRLLVTFGRDASAAMTVTPTKLADELSKHYREVICDEYQDSNLVQETILEAMSGARDHRYNRFMVGDVKQSIYRFRMADAGIFMDKYDHYSNAAVKDGCFRIDLHQNFRSRETVLDAVNFIFRRIMRRQFGGIEYDDDAALYAAPVYPEDPEGRTAQDTELLLLENNIELAENEDVTETKIELEARMVAERIHELTDPETGLNVFDSHSGTYHKAGYNDIVILMRSPKNYAEAFTKIFARENIPSQAELSTGFLATTEIRTMISLLQVIDNPNQDIPMAAVLLSPVGGLSNEDLALIHAASPDMNLYSACRAYARKDQCYDRLQAFLKKLNELREASDYLDVYELLQKIFTETGYYDYVQVMPGGERRKANLDNLLERAVTFQTGSFCGLFNFVRYVEQLEKNEVDFGEASLPSDEKGCVRIISAHKSKGLEFPIVFLAGMSKQFNEQDARSRLIVHRDYGLGLDAVNPVTRKKHACVYKNFISMQEVRETLAEEMRILYVAMTRAREKLIMTGSVNDMEKSLKAWDQLARLCSPALPDHGLSGASSYLDWVMPCLLQTDVLDDYMDRNHIEHMSHTEGSGSLFSAHVYTISDLCALQVRNVVTKHWHKEELLGSAASENAAGKALTQDIQWQYPWEEMLDIKGKYSVSDIKKKDFEADEEAQMASWTSGEDASETEQEEEEPLFMRPETAEVQDISQTGSFRGTAYHRVFELLHFEEMTEQTGADDIVKAMEAMTESGKLDRTQQACVDPEDICRMVHSVSGREMTAAAIRKQLHKEAQFVMGVPVRMVRKDIDRDDLVVIQGIIDVWYERKDGIVLLDYKTDNVRRDNGEETLKKHYKTQLDLYQYALEHITGRKVVQRLIYSTKLQKDFEV